MPGTKYSVKIGGQKTSITLEAEFWNALDEIADTTGITRSKFIRDVARNKRYPNLTSSLRIVILTYFMNKSRVRDPGRNGPGEGE
jgi:predicted DNA-binding ribbon-helix-helix protein